MSPEPLGRGHPPGLHGGRGSDPRDAGPELPHDLGPCRGDVAFKAENLQRTGSFKLRGALAKIAALGEGCAAGVVTGSAGNHGQAVAYAAHERGVPCEVFMPETASIPKVEAAIARGATVRLVGASVDEALAAARQRADEGGLAFVHPFEDPDVIAGQAGSGSSCFNRSPTSRGWSCRSAAAG